MKPLLIDTIGVCAVACKHKLQTTCTFNILSLAVLAFSLSFQNLTCKLVLKFHLNVPYCLSYIEKTKTGAISFKPTTWDPASKLLRPSVGIIDNCLILSTLLVWVKKWVETTVGKEQYMQIFAANSKCYVSYFQTCLLAFLASIGDATFISLKWLESWTTLPTYSVNVCHLREGFS